MDSNLMPSDTKINSLSPVNLLLQSNTFSFICEGQSCTVRIAQHSRAGETIYCQIRTCVHTKSQKLVNATLWWWILNITKKYGNNMAADARRKVLSGCGIVYKMNVFYADAQPLHNYVCIFYGTYCILYGVYCILYRVYCILVPLARWIKRGVLCLKQVPRVGSSKYIPQYL